MQKEDSCHNLSNFSSKEMNAAAVAYTKKVKFAQGIIYGEKYNLIPLLLKVSGIHIFIIDAENCWITQDLE